MASTNPSSLLPPPQQSLPSTSSATQSTEITDQLSYDFPQAACLSREEMTALLEDDAYFDAYFNTMPQALQLHQVYESRLKENIAIANKNEALRPNLDGLRTETANLFNEANELKARWSFLDAAQTDLFKRFTPQLQLNRLRYATSGQEQLSESLVSSFLDGQMDEDDFVRQYKEIRKVYHRRAGSVAKWEEGKIVWRT